MGLYVIGDIHLSQGDFNKRMDIFAGWDKYQEKLKTNWERLITEQDTVVIAGDISWALKLEDCYEDFRFLEALPGRKILLKGNHDLWWSTKNKVTNYCKEHEFHSFDFLFNNTILYDEYNLCGTRGWMLVNTEATDAEHQKIIAREIGRLELSLKQGNPNKETIVFFHYPPIYQSSVIECFFDLLERYQVKQCYYGHIHAQGCQHAYQGNYRNITLRLISADYLNFCPYYITK